MAITLTERAAIHVANYLAKHGHGVGIRLSVHTTGCSGMAYKIEVVDALYEGDEEFESIGFRYTSTRKACPMLMALSSTMSKKGFMKASNSTIRTRIVNVDVVNRLTFSLYSSKRA